MTDLIQDKGVQKVIDEMIAFHSMQQLTCMYLQYVSSLEIKKDMQKGMIMMDAVEKIRDVFYKNKKEIESTLSRTEIDESLERIGFYKKLYPKVTDNILEINSKYFQIPPRPIGDEYACDEKTCFEYSSVIAEDYFPDFYEDTTAA